MTCDRNIVLERLEALAPLRLAEAWDNVGLLLDPEQRPAFERAFLTIDLDEQGLAEALEKEADLIVAYHPPIFSGLKRLRLGAPGERLIVRALRAGLTIYSPHTALDAAPLGMADWLARALGPGTLRPIVPRLEDPSVGAGRIVELESAVELDTALGLVKAHLGLSHLRLSRAPTGPTLIRRLAVCPGAGGSLFERVDGVDLLLTGEMRHHDVLGRKAQGCHVILTEHTNSERGYLPQLAARLRQACPGLEVWVGQSDADPLVVA